MTRDVAQGSVLGPLLYILYVNDMMLPNAVMFADDTSLLVSAKKEDIAMETTVSISRLASYFNANRLHLNSKKTVLVGFQTTNCDKNSSHYVAIDGATIQQNVLNQVKSKQDLSKAFDCGLLLRKLERYGFPGTVNDWFRSYLLDRSQYVSVRVGDTCVESDVSQDLYGVPRGSALGYLLYL
ncbi:reverse transcriptase (rna-dependent dna polymerase) [Holotrichia oblita]|uniref:Reverse transcriptase (Rna-dependent dna polymerase) n=1 Tax=Holotrichia oblita TaxID=644536 RepID=A0ACB9T839_HOLOL|nr:reverse transcriptase (rna-dependent dna polymerase) [Holotrichia oblita]